MSLRARLTAFLAVMLAGSLLVFSVSLWITRKAAATDDLASQAAADGDNVLSLIKSAKAAGRPITLRDSANRPAPVVVPTQSLRALLDPLPGYFLVLDKDNRSLYSSTLVRQLSQDDQANLQTQASNITSSTEGLNVPISTPSADSTRTSWLLMLSRTDPAVGPDVSRVIAMIPTDIAELPPSFLVSTMIGLAPVILLLALGVAYILSGSAFRPVDQLINEVEAITDGRSLHRRVAADPGNDEIARLSATLNAMLARLEDSFGGLRRFTADASHELKTPLTVLRADIERAANPDTGRTDRMVALEEALQETARMADLVDSLLTLARADEGRFDLHHEAVRIEPLVREVLETAVILGEDAGLDIEVPVLENAVVSGDRTRLRQLLLNLVTNAIKYTPRGGLVEISASRRAKDEVAISVRDTGIGIAANDLPHVFERFWRADRSRSRASERGGFGLGLAICHWIAQAHGGSLTVQSRLGRGSLFTVILPTTDGTVVAAAQHELEESRAGAG